MNVPSIVSSDMKGDWRSFARKLFELEEADPGYMLLARAKLSDAQKLRYVLAWCTFYNPGLAAKASDYTGSKFYEYLRKQYPTAQRASERRHFRGQAGLKALAQWQALYPQPEKMIEACFGSTYLNVRHNMKHMAQMGDYFYWKLADIQDTVFHMPVDFTDCEKYMPKVPKQGAEIIHDLEKTFEFFDLQRTMRTVSTVIKRIPHPFSDRGLKLQEAETVCCVFKQHFVGDYKFGYRTAKAVKRLRSVFSHPNTATETASTLLDGVWAGGIWTPEKIDQIIERM